MSDGLTVQFQGESDWDAVINHWSLTIVEEDEFLDYIKGRGHGKHTQLELLETLYMEWEQFGRSA